MNKEKIVWRKSDIKNILLVTVGAFLTSFGLNIFVETNNIIPSGFTGVATLITKVSLEYFNLEVSFSLVYLFLNLVPALIVYQYIGRKFTILSLINVFLVSFFTAVIPVINFTDDMLLVVIFGGVFQALGTLSCLKADACSGGTDFVAIYYSQRYNRSVWNYVLAFNSFILMLSGALFTIIPALYSIIYQFTNTTIVNTFHDRYHLRTLTIITQHPNEVSKEIFDHTYRGITRWQGTGMYQATEQHILFMVVSANEADHITKIVNRIDPRAFITDSKIDKVTGNFFVKPFE